MNTKFEIISVCILLSRGDSVAVGIRDDVGCAPGPLADHNRDTLLQRLLDIQDGVIPTLHHHQHHGNAQTRLCRKVEKTGFFLMV